MKLNIIFLTETVIRNYSIHDMHCNELYYLIMTGAHKKGEGILSPNEPVHISLYIIYTCLNLVRIIGGIYIFCPMAILYSQQCICIDALSN